MKITASVAIVGLGPWGLCVLERLVDAARKAPQCELAVHVVEPAKPGGGIFAVDQPDYFLLNTPCGQHCLYPVPEEAGEKREGKGLYEWARERGYRWYGTQCRRDRGVDGGDELGDPISPGDFLPRHVMGEYLEWFYDALRREIPSNVSITHHRTFAEDVEGADGRETVLLGDGRRLAVDHVVLTTGHESRFAGAAVAGGETVVGAYPVEAYQAMTGSDEKVAIEGMGLAAFDALAALTVGVGGYFSDAGAGRLTYHTSGREPKLYMFSRSGYPYCAKSPGATDPMGEYKPAICTPEAVVALQACGAGGGRRQLDARGELLPLVFAEMELRYYTCAAFAKGGPSAAEAARDLLVGAWRDGIFAEATAQLAGLYGRFSAEEHFFVGAGRHYADTFDYHSQVYKAVASDLDEALVAGGASPTKAALETLRALRDTLRLAVEFKGLTLASHLDFVASLQRRFARLVAGPPAFRCQEMLALMDAGILRAPFGPSPTVEVLAGGKVLVRSRHLEQPVEITVDRLVRAHLDLPSVENPTSPLLANLAGRGRVRPLTFGETSVGSIDLSEDFHPIGRGGRAQERLWVFGVLTEGVRYFTLYVPSPKSRVRAFVDAEVCARSVVGGAREPVTTLGRLAGVGDFGRQARTHQASPLRVALINNMPDGAFAETESAVAALLCRDGTAGVERTELGRFTLRGVERGAEVTSRIAGSYMPVEDLALWAPDALVVTGAEPKKPELSEELYWPSLEALLLWAASSVPSMLVSCLSAHSALWVYDRLPRRLMPEKLFGVYRQSVDCAHPLMAGVGPVAFPHSRFNEIPEAALEGAGYSILARSNESGWTAAAGERGGCFLLLLQGHPEYTPLTLLREYRRDVRRYLTGTQGSYPRIPPGYLDGEGVEALEEFSRSVARGGRDLDLLRSFPYEFVAAHVATDWSGPATTFLQNWTNYVRVLCGKAFSQARGATRQAEGALAAQ